MVVSQFRVDIPGTQGTEVHRARRGAVRERHPARAGRVQEAGQHWGDGRGHRQHLRYADRRGSPVPEGNPRLFHTMQLLVATCGDRAHARARSPAVPSTTQPWRDPYPLTREELAQRLKKRQSAVTAQDILAGVVLHPYRLLDIVHNYVTFMQTDEGKTVKVVPRYQQYRAVCRAIDRLTTARPESRTATRTGAAGSSGTPRGPARA